MLVHFLKQSCAVKGAENFMHTKNWFLPVDIFRKTLNYKSGKAKDTHKYNDKIMSKTEEEIEQVARNEDLEVLHCTFMLFHVYINMEVRLNTWLQFVENFSL